MNLRIDKSIWKVIGRKDNSRTIRVRIPSMTGDDTKLMTVQQLEHEYGDCLIIDPSLQEQVDIKKLASLEGIDEVVVIPPIKGG